ncbi:TonB-dependent receptor [Luteolibacter sp. SL250]|uniref:TonB-dependent receptor plug domain-containing protein n=1 Tax=Luteolibacter sp. SL250 TaxID=2995170 RepID=UPI0022717E01|nr:TonB-dependent receptor [Luteolibacter sp. SL250]WAC17972.1 TonB-dependent receptor [Luteolibacter sp. SL250]
MKFRRLPFFPSAYPIQSRFTGSFALAAAGFMIILPCPAQAREETADPKSHEKEEKPAIPPATAGNAADRFELGQLTVYGKRHSGGMSGRALSQSVVTSEDIRIQNRNTLDDALRTTPGVQSSNSGGARNERMIYVRGFERWQVPLSIDGVRIYLPADNRLDYGRFLTPDLSEIQIHKGHASVLDGPGGMGGAINLVTRKPTREFEGELRSSTEFGNTGDPATYTLFGSAGKRQELFYLQASASLRDSDGYYLSRDYDPRNVGAGGPVQGKGKRDFSEVKDWRVNIKAGLTPNATDEYAVSYTFQEGEKFAPYHVRQPVRGITPGPLPAGTSYQQDWTWPQWNISTTSFNSHTQIGGDSYVKSRIYYNTFENLLSTFDDRRLATQATNRAFDSYYDDFAYGFSLEGGTELIPMNTLKTAVHYRRDAHRRWQHNSPGLTPANISPFQRRTEDTWSVAVEDTFHATDNLDLVAGASYDWYETQEAEFFNSGVFGEYPLFDNDAFNWQLAAIWRPTDITELYAGVSNRTRFPNLFERYSTRMGDAVPNPDLKPERAVNYQIGGTHELLDGAMRIGGAVFYSDIKDAIQPISIGAPLVQNQNVGRGETHGFEVSGEWDVMPALTLGGNYTYLHRSVDDPQRPNLKPVGTPEQLAYLYVRWRPLQKLTITPSVELSDSSWSTNRFEDTFTRVSGYSIINLNVEYEINSHTSVSVGIRNLSDKHYELADGYPEPGRTFHLATRITF